MYYDAKSQKSRRKIAGADQDQTKGGKSMKIKTAYYLRSTPLQMMIIGFDGQHYATNVSPIRHITPEELMPIPAYDRICPERYWGERYKVPEYMFRFYGLEVSD